MKFTAPQPCHYNGTVPCHIYTPPCHLSGTPVSIWNGLLLGSAQIHPPETRPEDLR